MSYVIGIDSGGTKTEGISYNLAGEQLTKVVHGFGNLLVDYEQGLANIKMTIEELLRSNGADCELIVLGLAGIDSSGLKIQLTKELGSYNKPLIIINDGKLAHLAVLKGQDGVLLISGTGSVVIGRIDDQWERVGGWGHLLGDEGSAYDIAKTALQVCLTEFDHGLAISDLTVSIMSYLKVNDVMALVKVFYQLNKGQVAALASVVAELAETDNQAQGILKAAGIKLAKQVLALNEKMTFLERPLKIGVNGSVIEKNQLVQKAFEAELARNQIDFTLIFESESSAKGAYYLYKKGRKN